MAQKKQRVGAFERRVLTISVSPVVEVITDGGCGTLTCGYCTGACTNCTATCRGAASTKHLQLFDPLEEVALDKDALIKVLTEMVDSIEEQSG